MYRDIIGSFVIKETRLFSKNKKYHLVFTRDRIHGIIDDYSVSDYIDEESGKFDRLEVLKDEDNFEVSYLEIRQIEMKQSGWKGSIRIETFNDILKYEIVQGQDYRNCIAVVQSAVGDKLVNKSPVPVVKFCPECRGEFQEWVTECPDCGVSLVDELPPEAPVFSRPSPKQESNILSYIDDSMLDSFDIGDVSEDTMISIATAPNVLIAEMWKGLLEEQGIPCMINKFNTTRNRYYSTQGGCEILVMVPEAKKAWLILQPFMDA